MATDGAPSFSRTLMEIHLGMRAILGSVARGAGLTAQQIELLCVLQGRTPAFGELAEMLGCDKTNITGMADRLERRNLVARTTDPADRRVTRLSLTDEGAVFGEQLRAEVASKAAARWEKLSTAERTTVVQLMSTKDF